jgi:hypothetical protein
MKISWKKTTTETQNRDLKKMKEREEEENNKNCIPITLKSKVIYLFKSETISEK